MPAQSGPQRQSQPTPVIAKEEPFEARFIDFPCAACGHYKARRTERESWYTCVNCGYSFGIEPHQKKHLRRAMDVSGSGPSSH